MQSSDDPKNQKSQPNAFAGNQREFLSLIDQYQRMLMKICWAYTRTSHDRDDLFQEIVGRLWGAFEKYDRNRSFSTWMYRIAWNVAIDFRRSALRRVVIPLDDIGKELSEEIDGKQQQLGEFRELLEALDEADRVILLLNLEGNSYREIGEILGISESNVGTRLNRLKQSLRESAQSLEK